MELPNDKIPDTIFIMKQVKKMFRDQRNISCDHSFLDPNNAIAEKWRTIYAKNEPFTLEYKPLPPGLKIIAEVRAPKNEAETEMLKRNLEFYRKQGYNAALLTFDTTEDIDRLAEAA